MKTEMVALTADSCRRAAALIRAGETVAFPTETVYGLGADALNEAAVQKIYAAKGRPSDNPLIVHVAKKEQISLLAADVPAPARKLIDTFMPGPITVVLKKRACIPACVTAGGDTVGIRIPQHEGARAFLEACGCPVAAPSANSSGKPSPTRAAHVLEDLAGRIPMILDGGPCSGGVESTVISVCGDKPLLLRPGLVSYEQLCCVLGEVSIHPSVLKAGVVDQAASPGMKYKHYSPKARVVIVQASPVCACALYDAAAALGKKPVLLWEKEAAAVFKERSAFALFEKRDSALAAQNLFAFLRDMDEKGYNIIFVQAVDTHGAGLSVMNRLLRASGFTVLTEKEILSDTVGAVKKCFS